MTKELPYNISQRKLIIVGLVRSEYAKRIQISPFRVMREGTICDIITPKGKTRSIPDRNVLGFLYHIIGTYKKDSDPVTGNPRGLPLGNQTSQWFALYYLDGVDRIIKEKYRIRYYTRYMDDMVLVHKDRELLEQCLAEIREYAKEELKLEFNQKTQLFPVSQGVDYLGWHFYLTDSGKVIRRLRTGNKRRFKRRLKLFKRQYAAGEKNLDDIKQSLSRYREHFKHGHT